MKVHKFGVYHGSDILICLYVTPCYFVQVYQRFKERYCPTFNVEEKVLSLLANCCFIDCFLDLLSILKMEEMCYLE
jgi:hypothetical protein